MTYEKSHTEAAGAHGASQATDTRKNATCALIGQEKRSGAHLDQITATSATAGMIERIARAWASIDGKVDLFDACKAAPKREQTEGYYGGYMAEAEELAKRAGLLEPAAPPAQRVKALVDEIRAILDQAHADLDEEFADAEYTGERIDLQDSETMVPTYLLERILSTLAPAEQGGAEVELVTNADELRAELRRALAQIDSLDAECDRRYAQAEAERDALKAEVERLREALTQSGDTKAAYVGEFYFYINDRDDDGNELARRVYVPWTTVKEIMDAIKARAALRAEQGEGGDVH